MNESLRPELSAFLAHEREIAPVPETTRARSLARARVALAAGSARPARRPVVAQPFRWAAAAAIVCVAGAAVGAVAYQVRARFTPPPAPVAAPRVASPSAPADDDARVALPEAGTTTRRTVRPTVVLSSADAARAELSLMGQARAAVARGDYAAALTPIAEHARRFKDGRLVEEREALRVKSLAGLGRGDEAQRRGVGIPRALPAQRALARGAADVSGDANVAGRALTGLADVVGPLTTVRASSCRIRG